MRRITVLPVLPSLLEHPETPLIHRDLSWLQFNDRVLDEARASSGNPLLERAKFLAISASNLDEFFMIRFASLGRKIRLNQRGGIEGIVEAGRLEKTRDTILEAVARFAARQGEVLDILASELAHESVHLVRDSLADETTTVLGKRVFESQVLPRLSPPETYDAAKLFTLENLKIAVYFPDGLAFRISRTLPQMYPARDDDGRLHFFFLDDLLLSFLGPTFGLKGKPGAVRITRDADFSVDLGDQDPATLPDRVRAGIGGREKGVCVRLQWVGNLDHKLLDVACQTLKLVPGQLIPAPSTLCLHGLWSLVNFQSPETLVENPKVRHARLETSYPDGLHLDGDVFASLRVHDWLLHHPYDSFDSFLRWLECAAKDADVERIELTLYRVDRQSPLVETLKEAARRGKHVRVIVELRARFDEANNLQLADDMRKAGVHVAFGFGKLKLHAKVALVTRREGDVHRLYTHLSTGNYNAATARVYTDMAILTANPDIGSDARLFFDAAWEGKMPHGFKRIVSAPLALHRRLIAHISAETEAARRGVKTRIVAKVNALVDHQVIEALYEASQAGVTVDLIVRGACSLIPQVPGLSENIRVISVVDRFLEHSRIYYFASQAAMYLSSADWMPRNFFSRLELAYPVLDERIFRYIEGVVIPTYLGDTVKARELTQQGVWKKRVSRGAKAAVRSQFVFERLARGGYDGTPLAET